jgi:hypothetical protein
MCRHVERERRPGECDGVEAEDRSMMDRRLSSTYQTYSTPQIKPGPYMPRYHFDVIGKNTIADRTGLLLPDDTHASDAADRLASELYEIR